MRALEYPFDSEYILKKARHLRKALLAEETARIQKRIAVLGGSTTHDVVRILELFLLNEGIEPVFYESEYNRYWQDAMFGEQPFSDFAPDLIYIHTSYRNLPVLPDMRDDEQAVHDKEEAAFSHFEQMWERLKERFRCPIIQNNFEFPDTRLLGNRDVFDIHGKVRFVQVLNRRFADYAALHEGFYINDIQYLSACYGLNAWADPAAWYLYKYALAIPAIPALSFQIASIIKSVFGRNKKALALDLDNTLWGGVIGDDGPEGIVIGPETAQGEAFLAFQQYLKEMKDIGVVLHVVSKNTEENAKKGLAHPDGVLHEEDFIYIRANWEPKSENVLAVAKAMNVLPESIVFVDDNPMERDIVTSQLKGVSAPPLSVPEAYIRLLDRGAYFEATNLSADDLSRVQMYRENLERSALEASFTDYGDYLRSLQMRAVIAPFAPLLYERIAQLTNKSNQFNLTTKRFTVDEIKRAAQDEGRITLYGRLTDRFGDNGVVSLLIGKLGSDAPAPHGEAQEGEGQALHIELWLMSCRVLKRDMEFAMMDMLAKEAARRQVRTIYGYYYPTAKNGMVEDFYALQGFEKIQTLADNGTVWRLSLSGGYRQKNEVIAVEEGEGET